MVAALYVERGGVYYGLPDVDPWDEERDARLYDGPWPVVAHPPCARWSRLAGYTEKRYGLLRGDDGGCFESALTAVRRFGGVLEHPAHSAAWRRFDLPRPSYRGWTTNLWDGGWTCYVEQGRYGHSVKKATWLYAYGVEMPDLRWGFVPDIRGAGGGRNANGYSMNGWRDRSGGYRGAAATPEIFRDVLLDMARSVSLNLSPEPAPASQQREGRCRRWADADAGRSSA